MPPATPERNHPVGRIVSRLVDCLIEQPRPERIILFGSRGRGEARPGSDIDLAVKGGRLPDFREERKLKERLDRLAGMYTVDLVFLERVDEDFARRVGKTGKLLYAKD